MLKLYAGLDGILGYEDDWNCSASSAVCPGTERKVRKGYSRLTPHNAQFIYTAVQSLFWITYGLMFVFAALYLQNRGLSNSAIGLSLGCAYGLSAILQPVLSRLFTRLQLPAEKAICRIYVLAVTLSAALLLAPLSSVPAAATLVIIFALESSLQPFIDTLAGRWTGAGYPVNFGISRGTGSLLYAGMTAGMGILLQRISSAVIPAFYIGTMSLIMMILLKFRMPENSAAETGKSSGNTARIGAIIKKPGFFPLLCGIGCLSFGHVLSDNFMLQIMQHIGGGSQNLGIAMAVASLMEFPVMLLFSRLNRQFRDYHLLVFSAWAWLAKNILIMLARRPEVIYVAEILQFCSYGLYIPASVQFISRTFPGNDHLTGQALAGSAYTIGCVIATFTGGAMLDAFGVQPTLRTIAIVTLAGAVLFTFAAGKQNPKSVIISEEMNYMPGK